MSLIDTIIQGQRWPRSIANDGVVYIHQSSRTGASPSNGLVPYPRNSLGAIPI